MGVKIHLKSQFSFMLLEIFNFSYKCVPFFFLKRIMLRLANINIGQKSYIHNARFFHYGKLSIGNNSVVNRGCYLDNRMGITIGNNVSIAHDTKIYSLGHDIDDPYFKTKGKGVIIEDYVCIFSNVLIMPGVKIGKGAVVYPGSVVTKDVGAYDVIGGNPARFIKKRNPDLKYELDYGRWFAL